MLIIDRRESGVPELLRPFGIEVCVTELEYGDCCFAGHGQHGDAVFGCERKKLSDLVNSMRDRRLSGFQLRGMFRSYDYVYLMAEGEYRPGPNGEILEMINPSRDYWRPFYKSGNLGDRGAVSYAQLTAYLTSLELISNVVVRRTRNAHETAAQYAALWHWSNDKSWDKHTSGDAVYAPPPNVNGVSRGGRVGMQVLREPNRVEKVAAQLAGIGDTRAVAAGKRFRSVRAMVNASRAEWCEVDGVAGKGADKIMASIEEEHNV